MAGSGLGAEFVIRRICGQRPECYELTAHGRIASDELTILHSVAEVVIYSFSNPACDKTLNHKPFRPFLAVRAIHSSRTRGPIGDIRRIQYGYFFEDCTTQYLSGITTKTCREESKWALTV